MMSFSDIIESKSDAKRYAGEHGYSDIVFIAPGNLSHVDAVKVAQDFDLIQLCKGIRNSG